MQKDSPEQRVQSWFNPTTRVPLSAESPCVPVPSRRASLAPVILGGFLGAFVFIRVFGVAELRYLHFFEPGHATPECIQAWAVEDHERSIEVAKKLPQDRVWRAIAGPWSDLDRCAVEGKRQLVLLGALVGGFLGGCVSLLIAVLRPPRSREWYDSLPLMGACFGVLLTHCGLSLMSFNDGHQSPVDWLDKTTSLFAKGALIGGALGYLGRMVLECTKRERQLQRKKMAFLDGEADGES